MKDTTLDEYPMPDPSIAPTALEEFKCVRKDLLPLSSTCALDLTENMTVLAVLPEGVLELTTSMRDVERYPPNTVFAVPRREWEASREFYDAVNRRVEPQTLRERAFLRHTGDCFAVYQCRAVADTGTPGHIPLETARKKGLSPLRSGFELVYTSVLKGSSEIAKLEERFREHPPVDFHHRKTRPGDIIVIKEHGNIQAWYLDMLAYNGMPGLLENVPLYRTGEHRERLPMTDEIPLYRKTGEHAQTFGELDAYFASRNANIACRDAIDRACAEHYDGYSLDTASAVWQVREEFGYERMMYVLACSIRSKAWDGRISLDNIKWAQCVPVIPDVDSRNGHEDQNLSFLIDRTHPGLLDLFVTAARQDYLRHWPMIASEISREAEDVFNAFKRKQAPNGPDGRSFVVQLSPEFVERANDADLNLLSTMMPFKSFEITPLRNYYSSGLFAQIAGDENRGPGRRLRNPSFKRRRPPAKQKKAPER